MRIRRRLRPLTFGVTEISWRICLHHLADENKTRHAPLQGTQKAPSISEGRVGGVDCPCRRRARRQGTVNHLFVPCNLPNALNIARTFSASSTNPSHIRQRRCSSCGGIPGRMRLEVLEHPDRQHPAATERAASQATASLQSPQRRNRLLRIHFRIVHMPPSFPRRAATRHSSSASS